MSRFRGGFHMRAMDEDRNGVPHDLGCGFNIIGLEFALLGAISKNCGNKPRNRLSIVSHEFRALDLKETGIRVNGLSPVPTLTAGLLGMAGDDPARQQGMLDKIASAVPLGRVGEPEKIAKAALFLATDDASFVNGAELFVDGGQAAVRGATVRHDRIAPGTAQVVDLGPGRRTHCGRGKALSARSREILGRKTPAEALDGGHNQADAPSVATTG